MTPLLKSLVAATAAFVLPACGSLPKVRLTHRGAPSSPPSPVAPAPAPAGAAISNELVATPSVRKAYYVGQLIDPAHPELMYRPGIVYREETPERWNRNPVANRGAVTGVVSALPDPEILPLASAEQQQLITQQQKVLQLLADSNRTREAAGEQRPAAGPEPASFAPSDSTDVARSTQGGAAVAPAINQSPLNLSRALVPNADGAIELSPEILDEVDRSEPNPFVKRHQAHTQYREIIVAVTGTAPGPRPTASVNGRLLNVGDPWEGFVVAAITRDAVYLQRDVFLLQIPFAREHGITIRLPQ